MFAIGFGLLLLAVGFFAIPKKIELGNGIEKAQAS